MLVVPALLLNDDASELPLTSNGQAILRSERNS